MNPLLQKQKSVFLFLRAKTLLCGYLVLWSVYCLGGSKATLGDFINPSLEAIQSSPGLAQIAQVYVINLDIRHERWINTQKQLAEFGVQPQRVKGINGWRICHSRLKQLYRDCVENEYHNSITPGQMGCFLSHVSILYDAFIHQYEYIWVLEDDISIVNDIRELPDIIRKLDQFDPEWDLLFTDINARGSHFEDIITFERALGNHFDYSLIAEPEFIPQENKDFRRIQYRLCTHSMVLSARGIKKLLDYFQSIKIAFPIDVQMHCCPNKRFYVSKKEYVTNGPRTISDTTYRPHL